MKRRKRGSFNKTSALLAAAVSLGLTGIAQAATITGFSLTSETPNTYVVADSVTFTSDSVSFVTNPVSNSEGNPWEATFEIDSDVPLLGDDFLGCALISGSCVPNADLNIFTTGFNASGDIAVDNNTIEWSDPIGFTGVTSPDGGGLLAEITGDQLNIWNFCGSPGGCGSIGESWTFQDLGPAAPEPASLALFVLGIACVAVVRRRTAGRS